MNIVFLVNDQDKKRIIKSSSDSIECIFGKRIDAGIYSLFFDQVHISYFAKDIFFIKVFVKVLGYPHIVDDEVEQATLLLILFNVLFGRVIIIH